MGDHMQQLLLLQYAMIEQDIIDSDIAKLKAKIRRRKRRIWQRKWLSRRALYGQYERLMSELWDEDVASFRNFVRMDPDIFQEIVARIGQRLEVHQHILGSKAVLTVYDIRQPTAAHITLIFYTGKVLTFLEC